MGFAGAVGTCLRKYVTFSGRASRSEYWWFFLFAALVNAAAEAVDRVAGGLSGEGASGVPLMAAALALILPNIAAGWRRMHDTGRPGWFVILPGLILAVAAVVIHVDVSVIGADHGRSGFSAIGGIAYVLGNILGAFGGLLVLFCLLSASDPDDNAYGPRPSA